MNDGTIAMKVAVEYVEPGSLRPAPYNPRRASGEALKRLARLLDAHGFVDPVIARRSDRMLIGGHQRLKANALRQTPDTLVPVVFLDDIDDARAKALNVALNNSAAQGVFDLPALGELLSELAEQDVPLPAVTGFSEDEIANLLGELDAPAPPGEVEIPESFQVVAEVESEAAQKALYDELSARGLKCRLLVM